MIHLVIHSKGKVMTYPTIRDLVQDRSDSQGYGPGVDLKGVSVRLEAYRVSQLDILSRYLGYTSRQQLVADLLTTSIDDALQELSAALEIDVATHEAFTASLIEVLQERSGAS